MDARTDVFSFGAVLYEMVTGQRAFQGDTRISTLSAILHKEPTPLHKIVEAAPPDLEKTDRLLPAQRSVGADAFDEGRAAAARGCARSRTKAASPGSGGHAAELAASHGTGRRIAGRPGGVGAGLAALLKARPPFLPAHAVRNRGRPRERAGLVAGRQDSRLCRRGQWRPAGSYPQPGCARDARHQLVFQLQLSFLVAGWKPHLLLSQAAFFRALGQIFGRSGLPEGSRNSW